MNQRQYKKVVRQKTLAGPGNYFITVAQICIRVPHATGIHVNIMHDEKFTLIKEGRLLMFHRNPKGVVVSKHYKRTMMFYGAIRIRESGIKLGRYHYCPELSTDVLLTFKYDPSWI
jgi:hypothetical protein